MTIRIARPSEARAPEYGICRNCERFEPALASHCPIASALHELSSEHGIAVPVTGCPLFTPRDDEME